MIEVDCIEGWVFDLDDTLFLERDYVRSGFAAVDRWLIVARQISGFYDAALRRFEAGARRNIFDLALADLGTAEDAELIRQMIACYRAHSPDIALEPGAKRLLQKLANKRIAVVSDGLIVAQLRKVEALGLRECAAPIVLTDDWGREFWKPHERAFRFIEDCWSLSGRVLVYVGDNPAKDFKGPSALGWQTIRMRREFGEHANVHATAQEVSVTVASPDEIIDLLERPVCSARGGIC